MVLLDSQRTSEKNVYEYHAEHFIAWLLNYDAFKTADPKAAEYFDQLMANEN